jgi:hypothetical protein
MNYTALPLLTKVLILSGILIAFISTIWFIVLGFQRHKGWGVALLLGGAASYLPYFYPAWAMGNPFANLGLQLAVLLLFIVYIIYDWEQAKQPFFWFLTALILGVAAGFTIPNLKVNTRGLSSADKLRGIMSSAIPQTLVRQQTHFQEQEPPPQARFRSKLPAPTVPQGEPEPPRPGYYYLKERISVITRNGIKAANPGEMAILLKRLPREKMLIQVGEAEFEVESHKLTNDLNQARALEKQDFVSRGGRL